MASTFERKPPAWFLLVSVLLLLWELMGAWSWWEHKQHGAYGMGATPTAYDIQYFAALPSWYVWLFALAVGTGVLGGILLLARNAAARPVFALSLVATVAMFAYTFLATDKIAVKGVWVTYFPALIVALGVFSLWWAGLGIRRGWLR